MTRFTFTVLTMMLVSTISFAGSWTVKSPDGKTSVAVSDGPVITYSVSRGETLLIDGAKASMKLSDADFGADAKVRKVKFNKVDRNLDAIVYKKASVRDNYNEMVLSFKGYDVIFRAYDDGVAYRFVSRLKGDREVVSERAEFNFAGDWNLFVPYVDRSPESFEAQFYNSFENTYSYHKLSEWQDGQLAFLPLVVEAPEGIKVLVTEADLLDYPGMYLYNYGKGTSLSGVYAGYPDKVHQGGHNMLQGIVDHRADYIAKVSGETSFPWRVIVVSDEDKQLANSDMVWKLSTAPVGDYSWVKPGKVAWDWWNDWNIYGVDFESGINNDTYKYYIDFAAANGIAYVILDEGWAVNLQADLMQIVPEIDLEMLSSYARSKGVDLILWAGYWAFERDMEEVCRHYSEMGIKGFKIDFMDRDDQLMVEFYRKAAETAAKYNLMVDFHGAFKPAGLNRTYPNVINFEAVFGLENMKWSQDADEVTYDVTIPFIRMVAGPFDYTQGAMHNGSYYNYRANHSEPMSQGTRCRQLAEYVVFESPLNMLCDSPSNYMREPECTAFISAVPTVWDETVALDGKIADYVAIARRSGEVWYVGAMTDWDGRDMVLDLSFLGEGQWKAEIFRDGVNADRKAIDYVRETVDVPADRRISVHLASGGGCALRLVRK